MRHLCLMIPPDPPESNTLWGRSVAGRGTPVFAAWVRRFPGPRAPERTLKSPDIHSAAAIAEQVGVQVQLLDSDAQGWRRRFAVEKALSCLPPARPEDELWIGVLLSPPSLTHDLAFAKRIKVFRPDARVFLYGGASGDHWVPDARGVDAIVAGGLASVIGPMLAASGDGWKRVVGVIDPNARTGERSSGYAGVNRRPVSPGARA